MIPAVISLQIFSGLPQWLAGSNRITPAHSARSGVLVILVSSIRLATKNGMRGSAGWPRDDVRFFGVGASVASVMARGRKRFGWLKRERFFGWAMRVENWPRREDIRRRTWVEKSDGQWPPLVRVEVGPDFPEMAIGCLTPVGTSDDSETLQTGCVGF